MVPFKPIVVGVDASAEGGLAAAFGWELARRAQTSCYLIHGTREVADIPLMLPANVAVDDLRSRITARAIAELREALRPHVPPRALERLRVRLGNPAMVLQQAVREYEAGLVILGGKHHAPPVRWLGGSTALHAVRTLDVPLWVVPDAPRPIRRILAAVDLSYATAPALEVAKRVAELFSAELRALHVAEFAPMLEEYAIPLDVNVYYDSAAEELGRLVTKTVGAGGAEPVLRMGVAGSMIAAEVGEWGADLLVVGSHGKGWVDRVLIGSTTERLLNKMPTAMLVVPVGPPPGGVEQRKPVLSAKERANA